MAFDLKRPAEEINEGDAAAVMDVDAATTAAELGDLGGGTAASSAVFPQRHLAWGS